MHTSRSDSDRGGRQLKLLALAALVVTLVALSVPAATGARVHSFRALKVQDGVATFKLKHLKSKRIRSARLISSRGTRKLSLRRVRRALRRRGVLRVRVPRRSTKLRIRSKRGRLSARRKKRRTTSPTGPTGSTQPAPDPVVVIDDGQPNPTPSPAPPPTTSPCQGGAASFFDPSGFGGTSWPPPCWRPFADGTPFNQRLGASPMLSSNSSQLVANLMTIGPINSGRAGIADTCDDWQKVLFWATGSDPVWRIEGGSTVSPYDIDGAQIRMPASAHPAGCVQDARSDRHLGVVYNGYEYGMWNVRIDAANRVIYPETGRKVPVSGDGLNASCTNARFACLAGRIRYQELEAGRIDHALFATTNHLRTGSVYPARQGSTNNPSLGSDWPQNGTRVQLDPSYATDQWLARFPAWKQAILRALRDYGAYFGDDTSSPMTFTSFESGTGYTALGLADPFEKYAQDHLGQEITESGGIYYLNLRNGVDWSKLRVIDSCVAERTC
jgi:hypothetical protein